MSTDIAVVDSAYAQSSLEERKAYASAISGAGELVPPGFRNRDGSPNPAKLLLAFEYGAMLGIHPMASVKGINVIDGQTSASPALMTGLVRRAGHKLRIDKTGSWKEGTFTATVTLIRSDDPQHPFTSMWDADRAKQAGLLPASSPRASWARYPQNMCVWRAVSEACREGAEDVLFGLHYTPEELGAEVNDAGEVIDGEIVEEEPEPRNNGTRGHASETRVSTGPDAKATPAGGSRQSPSRPVTSPGSGRAPKRAEPPFNAGDYYFTEAMQATDLDRLRDVYREAKRNDALGTETGVGMTVGEAIDARKEALEEQTAADNGGELPPPLDGIEEPE
jgi:hypothetical protein